VEAGIDTDSFAGGAADVRAAIARAKRREENVFGLDYSAFTDAQLTERLEPVDLPQHGAERLSRGRPGHALPASPDRPGEILLSCLDTGAIGPSRACVPRPISASNRRSTSPARSARSAPIPNRNNAGVGDVLQQDIDNMAAVQRGLASAGMADGLRLSETGAAHPAIPRRDRPPAG